MGQLIHIFRKDVRHFWREIVLSLGILTAFVWNTPRGWLPERYPEASDWFPLSSWLPALIALSWVLLILRAVEDEPLVGDRQFWLTRPYEWKRLLAEKILFVLTFINLPLFVAQLILLRVAGFAPFSFVKELLWIQVVWMAILILPMATLATVSAGMGSTVLAVLGIVVFLTAFGTLSARLHLPHPAILRGVPQGLLIAVLLGTFVVVVVWQYARRRTGRARLLLAIVGSAVLLIGAMTPGTPFSPNGYPLRAAGQSMPVMLAFDSAKHVSDERPPVKDKVLIEIPLLAAGVAANSAVEVDGKLVQIEAPGGLRWESGWERGGMNLLPDESSTLTTFEMDKSSFERMKSAEATVHLSFAMTAIEPSELRQIPVSGGVFSVPGGAYCWIQPESLSGLVCRAPLRSPFLVASTNIDESTCGMAESPNETSSGTIFYGWNWNGYSGPGGPEMSPVEVFQLQLMHGTRLHQESARICPGTPITFATLREGKRMRSELTIEGIRLADYKLKEFGRGLGAVSIGVHAR